MATCGGCEGTGKVTAMACPGWRAISIECLDCHGSGEISAEQARANEEREKTAQERRRWRIDRDLTIAQAAREKGVGIVAYSRWERGLE